MKRYLLFLIAMAALTACEKTNFPKRKDIALTKNQLEVLSNVNGFAFKLLNEVYPREEKQEVFLSPFSMSCALSMLANGASGETYNEIARTLGYENSSVEDINSAYKTVTAGLLSADKSSVFAISNGLWLNSDRGFSVKPAFSSALKDNYDAASESLSFSARESLDRINGWVSEKTKKMIPLLFERLEPDWNFLLANALYFKGTWTEKFPKSATKPKPFHNFAGEDVTRDFMEAKLSCNMSYSEHLGALMCELPFGNKAFVLDMLLPNKGIDFNAFVAGLDADKWESMISALVSEKGIFVSVPKMDLSFKAEKNILIPSLKALGIVSAFNGNADFSAMTTGSVCIDNVIQKTRFRMDEDGAEAAAVTIVAGKDMANLSSFIADHPFVYAIRETSTNTILFLGAYRGL